MNANKIFQEINKGSVSNVIGTLDLNLDTQSTNNSEYKQAVQWFLLSESSLKISDMDRKLHDIFGSYEVPEIVKKITPNKKDIKDLLAPFAGKAATRFYLNGIFYDKKTLTAQATSGHILAVIKVKTLDNISAIANGNESVIIGHNGKAIDGHFPNLMPLISKSGNFEALNVKKLHAKLLGMLKASKYINNKYHHTTILVSSITPSIYAPVSIIYLKDAVELLLDMGYENALVSLTDKEIHIKTHDDVINMVIMGVRLGKCETHTSFKPMNALGDWFEFSGSSYASTEGAPSVIKTIPSNFDVLYEVGENNNVNMTKYNGIYFDTENRVAVSYNGPIMAFISDIGNDLSFIPEGGNIVNKRGEWNVCEYPKYQRYSSMFDLYECMPYDLNKAIKLSKNSIKTPEYDKEFLTFEIYYSEVVNFEISLIKKALKIFKKAKVTPNVYVTSDVLMLKCGDLGVIVKSMSRAPKDYIPENIIGFPFK